MSEVGYSRAAVEGGAVLHLCGDFAKQQIYTLLVKNLAQQGVEQVVYAPVRTAEEAAWDSLELSGVRCHLRHILVGRDRFFFRRKVNRVAGDVQAKVDLSTVRLVHAHFLYSDGAVALKLKRRFGLPFIVAVRNTDVNVFMRFRPDLFRFRDAALSEAARVVFLSHAYEQHLGRRIGAQLRGQVAAKTAIIPNGVRDEWLISPPMRPPAGRELSLLYVGDFTPNKNVLTLLEATALLARARAVRLTLVGGDGKGAAEVERALESGRYPFAKHIGRTNDSTALRDIYRTHDIFVMPSIHETFGVAYIEALSQGLPIVHSHGQGIDGYFSPGGVAEAVDPRDPVDIAAKIVALAERLPAIRGGCIREAGRFDWRRIAGMYADIYRNVAINAERAP